MLSRAEANDKANQARLVTALLDGKGDIDSDGGKAV
jgi:hypothetical protein